MYLICLLFSVLKKKKLLLPINASPVNGHPVLFSRPVTCLTRCTRLPRRSRTITSSPTRPRQWHIVNCCPLLEFTKRAAVSLSAKNFLPKHFWMFYLYAIFIFRFHQIFLFFFLKYGVNWTVPFLHIDLVRQWYYLFIILFLFCMQFMAFFEITKSATQSISC